MASNWTADLAYGKAGEFWLTQLGQDITIEVKRDRRWATTGNVFFEISCSGKPSGVMSTEASYFAYILDEGDVNVACYLWKTEPLKIALQMALNAKICKTVSGGDGNRVIGIVFPLDKLGELTKLCQKK